MLLENTPTVLSLGKLCEDHGFSHQWSSGQKPHLIKNGRRIDCNISNNVPFVVAVYLRVPLQRPHLLHHHFHHRTPYLMSTDTPKIQFPKEMEARARSYGETRCKDQQKTKTKIKMKDTKKYRAIYCMTCRSGCRNSERIWSMKVLQQSLGETLRLRIETLPVLLMNYQWSRERKWNRVRASIHCVYTHFPKDLKCDICLKTKK